MAVIKNNIIFDKGNNLAADIYFPNDTSSETKILIFGMVAVGFVAIKAVQKQ